MSAIERLAWADVSRVQRGGGTARLHQMRWPLDSARQHRELETRALAELAQVAATPIDEPRVLRWCDVGSADDAWALESDFDGAGVDIAWRMAARVRPHDLELSWRDPGQMAADDTMMTAFDRDGRETTKTRKGPWDARDPITHPSRSRHRTVRVRVPPIEPRLAIEVALEAARAVRALHAAGLAHGMLTTEAIVLLRDGTVAVRHVQTGSCRYRTVLYSGSGSPERYFEHLAPEMLDGAAASPASDVFQLASALYELVAFSPPWLRATPIDTILALRGESVPPISMVSPTAGALDDLLACALARGPATRPSLDDLIATLAGVHRALPSTRDSLARVIADAAAAPVSTRADVPL